MSYVTFGTFETRSPLLTSDYLVGYKTTGPTEIKTQVKDILNLISDSDAQTLSYNENNKNLAISSGNSVSLSSLTDLTLTNTLTGQLVTKNFVQTNFFPLSGGIISGATRINNNLTVNGNLTATGTATFANTVFSTTSSLSVVHIGAGPAMWVGNNGTGDIASFYDIDQGIEILHVGGENGTFPNVGVKTSQPNKALTVNGEISANNTIHDTTGNSQLWNRAYNVATTYQSASATLYAAPSAVVQIFTSSGTWTKPLSAKIVHVVAIGGGAGGGSGRYDSASTARAGGGGGGGGAYSFMTLNALALPNTVTVTVGASGAGGTAQTTLAQNGNPGGAGGESSFGTILRAAGGAAGPGGTTATGSLLSQSQGIVPGGLGGVGQLGSSTSRFGTSSGAAGGGGGGGGCSATNTNSAGGDGGVGGQTANATAGTGGTTGGGAGGNATGTIVTEPFPVPGSGGGGGGGSNLTNGGNGGNGLNYGGGGGGGAGSNGSQSGAGGNGGVGIVVVTTYF